MVLAIPASGYAGELPPCDGPAVSKLFTRIVADSPNGKRGLILSRGLITVREVDHGQVGGLASAAAPARCGSKVRNFLPGQAIWKISFYLESAAGETDYTMDLAPMRSTFDMLLGEGYIR